jgi:hypothetical protein
LLPLVYDELRRLAGMYRPATTPPIGLCAAIDEFLRG